MTETLLHRHTLATSLFLLSTLSPCTGTTQKSQQNIDGQKLLRAIRDMDKQTKKATAKATAIALLNKTPTPNLHCREIDLGDTSLHWAANRGYTDIVQLLLEKGANPSVKNYNDDTPLHDAIDNGHQDIVELLLLYNADKSISNKNDETPLALANKLSDSTQHKQAIIQRLQIDNPGNPNGIPPPTPIQIQTHANIHLPQGRNPDLAKDKGIAILILLGGLGYIFWPKSQNDDPPRHTKAKQKRRKRATRTATAK